MNQTDQIINIHVANLRKTKDYKDLIPEHQQLLGNFADYLILQQLAYKTTQRKIYMAKRLLMFIQNLRIFEITSVTSDIINTFLVSIKREISRINKPITGHYLVHYYAAVKDFFNSLHETGKILINPAEKLTPPKKNNSLPRNVLSKEEVVKIIEQPNIKTYRGLMARAIFEIMYGCGLRTGEICNLSINDIDLKSKTIHIKNAKGVKDRIIPIGDVAILWFEKYLQARKPLRPDLETLFLTARDNKPLGHDYIARVIREHVKQADITKKIVPHSFRHTFATHLLEEGASIRHIQALLGHSSIDSTQIYTHVANPDLKKLHSMLHPRESYSCSVRDKQNKKGGRHV